MNKKIYYLCEGISTLLKVYIFLMLMGMLFIIYMLITNSSHLNINSEPLDAYFILFHSVRQSGIVDIDQNIFENINVVVRFTVLFINIFIFYIISDFFGKIAKGDTPFKSEIVKKLRVLAYLFLADFLVFTFLPSILFALFIEGKYIEIMFDGGRLLLALIFYTLSEIFAYGVQLQKDSDETL